MCKGFLDFRELKKWILQFRESFIPRKFLAIQYVIQFVILFQKFHDSTFLFLEE